MTPKDFYALDAKLRRTTYAVVWDHLLTHTDTLTKQQVQYLSNRLRMTINEAVENSVDFMLEHEIIKPIRQRKKTKNKRAR